jgi:hypothetical protein
VIFFFGMVASAAFWIAGCLARTHRTARLLSVVSGLWVALPYLGARTQLISLLGLSVVLWLWNRIQAGQRLMAWALPPLFLLWSNLHGGFTAGLFVLAVVLGCSAVLQILADQGIIMGRRFDEPLLGWTDLGHVAGAALLSAAVTLVNPYGWHLHAEIYASLSDRYMLENLAEWQPVSFQGWAGRAYLLYLTGLSILIVFWYRRREPVRWALLAVFFILSLLHWRNVTLFLLVSIPLAAELLADASDWVLRRLPPVGALAKAGIAGLTLGAALILIRLGPDHLVNVWRAGTMPDAFFEQTEYPIEAVRWISTHPQAVGARLYNDYGYGGFLVWWLPQHKIFIDGRMPAWRLGDRWIFADYMLLNQAGPSPLDIMEKYGVDWALVGKQTPLAASLATDPGWRLLYVDPKVEVFRRGN